MVDDDVNDVRIMQFTVWRLRSFKNWNTKSQINTWQHETNYNALNSTRSHSSSHNYSTNNSATMIVGKRCRKSRCDNFDQRRCRANSRDALCWILHVNASFCTDDRVSLVGNGYRWAADRKLLASRRQRGCFADTVLSTLADIRGPMNRKWKASFAQRHAQIAERLNRTVGRRQAT